MKFSTYSSYIKNTEGQLLIELLIALFVGGIFLIGSTLGITSILRYSFETRGNQTASGFAIDMLRNTQFSANSNWHSVYDLSKGTSYRYMITPYATSVRIISGTEGVLFNDVFKGMVGQWKFDENSTTIAYDTSGNGNDGTFATNPTKATTTSQCVSSGCILFDGSTGGYVSTATSSVLNFGTGSFSVSMWGYFRDYTYPNSLFMIKKSGTCYQSGSPGWDIGHQYNANGVSVCYSDGANSVFQTPTFDVGYRPTNIQNTWAHLVVVFDKTTNTVKFYVNGVKQTQEVNIASVTGSTDNGYPIRIGAMYGWKTTGYMDDVRLYNRVLSAQEIKNLYESPIYIRYMTVENVNRDTNGAIVLSGGTNDPSTQKVTYNVVWDNARSLNFYQYLTRSNAVVFQSSDWSGGYGNSGIITSATSTFATSSNITYQVYSYLSLTTTTANGWLESPIFDTQIVGGATVNSIMWQGTAPAGTVVQFQLAASNTTSTWTYYGSDGSPSTYFTPTTVNTSLPIMNTHNYRYFRYKVFLVPNGTSTPIVDDIVINWSK